MGKSGIKKVEAFFDLDRIANQNIEFYKSVIHNQE